MSLNKKQKGLLTILIIVGTISQSITMVRSGLIYPFGMGFWGPNGHDGIWHIALANQILKGFPPPHPTFSGEILTNYHYFYDLLLSLFGRITSIPVSFLYFQVFPILFAFCLGLFSFLVGWFWKKDFWTGFWLVFFNYFGSSFGYLVTLLREKKIGGESLFWSMQSASNQINPPFALSLVVILFNLFLFLKIKRWDMKKMVLISFLWGILINIKAYAGIVGLVGLGACSVFYFFKKKKEYLIIFWLALLISGISFWLTNQRSVSLFVFKPFWFIHSMIESTDRFYLPKLAQGRYLLLNLKFWPKLFLLETFLIIIFLFGNSGTRIIGFLDVLKKIKKPEPLDIFLIFGGLVGFIIPLFFVQKGTAWNTIQFFYYFLFFLNFYAAETLSSFKKGKKFIYNLMILLIIFLTLPSSVATLQNYLGWPPPAAISKKELEALEFLKNQKDGVVLTYPYDKFEKKQYPKTPIPLRAYESTAYVSAFTGKQTFLEDEMNLTISGYDWEKRMKEIIKFFGEEKEIFWARGFLINNKIKYIYLTKDRSFKVTENQLGIKKIFENDEVKVFEVQ